MMVDSDAEFMVSITVNINVYGKQKYRSLCEFAGRWLFDTSQQPSFCMLNKNVVQCLAGQAPSYLSDDCQPVSDSRPCHLQLSDSLSCVVRCAHNTYGDRCFATAWPRVWNSWPAEMQQCSSLRQFKRCLKTFLCRSWDYGALWLFVNQRCIEIFLLTYLLTYVSSACLFIFFSSESGDDGTYST